MSYQARWVRGVETPGDRSCADRYALVREVVRPFTRQVTVWDIGANLGYFGCRLADEFGAVAVMIDPRPALLEVVRANAIPTTIAMTQRLSAQDLAELAASEHVDVVLALNVLHHCDDPLAALANVLALGETVVIETPGRGDTGSAHYEVSQQLLDVLETLDVELMGTTPSHVTPGVQRPLYRVTRHKPCVTRGYAYGGRVRPRGPHAVRPHRITATLGTKTIDFADGESRPWVAGMNLWNWLQLGGRYPDRAAVRASVDLARGADDCAHGDLRPWNVILSGETATLIDRGHRASIDDVTGLRQTLEWIDRPELAYVR